jgi:hypothetical protein
VNLHNVVRGSVRTINPDVPGSWYESTGYATGADGTQAPSYAAAAVVPMQVQPLTGKDLKQLDNLNIQGVTRTVFMNGDAQGVQRAQGKGGDLIGFGATADVPADLQNTWWLVVCVLETWGVGFCKLGLTEQLTGPPGV